MGATVWVMGIWSWEDATEDDDRCARCDSPGRHCSCAECHVCGELHASLADVEACENEAERELAAFDRAVAHTAELLAYAAIGLRMMRQRGLIDAAA